MNSRQLVPLCPQSGKRELDAGVLSVFSFLFNPGSQPTGRCHPFLNQSGNSLKTLQSGVLGISRLCQVDNQDELSQAAV